MGADEAPEKGTYLTTIRPAPVGLNKRKMTEKEQMSKALYCGITVSGEVYALAQLSAKFQIKARDYGLDDSESLAVWIEGGNKIETYFEPRTNDYRRNLESGKAKLQKAPKNWKL
jgi:hypothetical protein